MAIRFLDIRRPPTALSGTLAILSAISRKARVINAAWGVGIGFWSLRTAIRLAGEQDIVVVAAAGNDGLDNDRLQTYPASYQAGAPDFCPNLIAVMASDPYDDKASFSNYGATRVDLAAPGVGVLTTETYLGTPRWRPYSGTSAACAYVTYAAALLRTMHRSWTAVEIRDHLVASVDKSPWLKCVAQGRLSLERAVQGPFTFTSPVPGDRWVPGTPTAITWTNSYVTGRRTTSVTIHISRNGGAYTTIAGAKPNSGNCIVTAPSPVAAATLRIRSDQGPGLYADSGDFRVQ